ncbi:N-acetylmuramoyl-L-alanine amidase [Desulfosporosinus acidiphilus SJ4]|uniref:N-acetylmuramoyl-L-alanine amidase n=1 Tax=Desulfosporosinus acidiphilus (strain DSM 22704 / JCM 16185 / SJ4) TaxID=646529 RepID=I4D9W5_DESAJ|nr:peptidoglycan recognition family protein [Desulfosporosinus acidiphilus]AFM42589.1 N-acetylmuramoyl-L-alanine amidase [Desulfosporosinus acidiphilus SJ4]
MDWQKIVIHHTASPTEVKRFGKSVPVDAKMIRGWHKTKGWSDIGYNFVIMPDGSCQDGRPLSQQGAHCKAGKRNSMGIGVCLVGNFSETTVPEAQLDGLVNKIVQLLLDFNLGIEDVELHREVPGAVTECPGRNFPVNTLKKKLEAAKGC